MDEIIQNFISSKNIAIVGASNRRMKFGNIAYRSLKKKGYNVYPVNPNQETIGGDRCYPNLLFVPEDVEAVVVVIPPEKAIGLVDKALKMNIDKMWFQRGADFSNLASKAEKAGIRTVSGKCILMYAPPVKGIHAVHRFFSNFFNKKEP